VTEDREDRETEPNLKDQSVGPKALFKICCAGGWCRLVKEFKLVYQVPGLDLFKAISQLR